MQLLLVVQHVFVIAERGVAVTGELVAPEGESYHIGDPVEIRHANGSVTNTVISGIPLGTHKPGEGEVLLPCGAPENVKLGDTLWLAKPQL